MTRALCVIAAALAASAAGAAVPPAGHSVARDTSKSTDQFAACFIHAQERASAPWWFVPKENGGGTFSNLGANGVSSPYFVDVSELGSRREIRLDLASASADASVLRAIDSCV
jgi:hypothetical protein